MNYRLRITYNHKDTPHLKSSVVLTQPEPYTAEDKQSLVKQYLDNYLRVNRQYESDDVEHTIKENTI